MPTKNQIGEKIGRFLKDLFTKNIAIKIISILFALMLWGYVLTIENPEYSKIVRAVPINMTNESTLTDKGLMVVSRDVGETDVTVLCQISKHSELDASRITATVNLADSSIHLDEDEDSKIFPLTVTTTVRTGFGTITAVDRSTVNVEIARVSTRTGLPVSIEYTGSLPEGFEVVAPERLSISVKGMKSVVSEIAKGVITIDLDAFPTSDPATLAGQYSGVYAIRFYNSSNVGLDNIYNDSGDSYSLEVPITIRAYKVVDIVPDITVEDGYDYDYVLSQKTITLYGSRALLDTISNVATAPIVALPEMTAEEVTAQILLPDQVTIDNQKDSVTVTLTVVDQITTKTYTVPISVRGLDSTLARGENFPTEANVQVTGTVKSLEKFTEAYITATLDLNGCEAGTYSLPLKIDLDNRASNVTASVAGGNVSVTLVPKTTEE